MDQIVGAGHSKFLELEKRTSMVMDLNLRFTPQQCDRVRHDWEAWWNHDLKRPIVVIERIDGFSNSPEFFLTDIIKRAYSFPMETPVEEIINFYSGLLNRTNYYGDAFPRLYPEFEPGIVAAFLGARVIPHPDTIWFEPETQLPISELPIVYDPHNLWWQHIQSLTRCATEYWTDQVTVGFVDLGGNLDILSSLLTPEQMLLDMVDAPEELDQAAYKLTHLWLRYYKELEEIINSAGAGTSCWAQMWAPGSFYMLQSDHCVMISPEMFERFVMPDLKACYEAIDYPFYHLDGEGQIRHLDMLLSLDKLRGIQWVPGDGAPPPEDWLDLLARIRDGGKLCQVDVDANAALKITRELGGRGFCFVIMGSVETDEIAPLLAELAG